MKKSLIVVIAIALVCVIAAGVTVAWLTSSAAISNTFTVGKIAITMSEPGWIADSKIYPGAQIAKNPTISVTADSEDCYVYAMIDNKLGAEIPGAVTLNISSDWTQVGTSGTKTVYRYHAVVAMSSSDQPLTPVFSTVQISTTAVTETNIGLLDGKKIDVQAFAHQSNAISMADADAAALAHFGI